MLPELEALVALQHLDTLAETARRRMNDMPAVEREMDGRTSAAAAAVEAAKAQLTENQRARRELEKQVAQVDTRLARFDEHKAAIKTNHEFTALLHEISTAKSEKDTIEEQILGLLETADTLTADLKTAENGLKDATREGDAAKAKLNAERRTLDEELARLAHDRSRQTTGVSATLLAKYEQLLKQRRMIAVAAIQGELCTACHVRMRPAVAQNVRRGADIIQCDSCQRILYQAPAAGADASRVS